MPPSSRGGWSPRRRSDRLRRAQRGPGGGGCSAAEVLRSVKSELLLIGFLRTSHSRSSTKFSRPEPRDRLRFIVLRASLRPLPQTARANETYKQLVRQRSCKERE